MFDSQRQPIKIALGSVPKDGGTFTFYRNQRRALAAHGIDLTCVTIGAREASLIEPGYSDEGCAVLADTASSIKDQAMAFSDWCDAQGVDIVMGLNSVAILSALPHLSGPIRVVARCANGFTHGYRITLAGKDRIAKYVALTPRLRDDLVDGYGVRAEDIAMIPNGVDRGPYEDASAHSRGQCETLRLGYLGRLEHSQKGVLHLIGILEEIEARGVPFQLRVAGKGRHGEILRRGLSKYVAEGSVRFDGAIGPGEIPRFLGETDVFLFTSHFEGCPNALLESMMAGAVPVAARIEGTTDFLIENGRTGFVEDVSDYGGFARRVEALHKDRTGLGKMGRDAADFARSDLESNVAAARYSELFKAVMDGPPPDFRPKPWSDFRTFEEFSPGLITRLGRRIARAAGEAKIAMGQY